MATVTRTIYTATGAGLKYPNGSPVVAKKIMFTLVDATRRPVSIYDSTTSELIAGTVSATTDVNGEFSVSLWPTSRGNKPCLYSAKIEESGFHPIVAPLDGTVLTNLLFPDWCLGAV